MFTRAVFAKILSAKLTPRQDTHGWTPYWWGTPAPFVIAPNLVMPGGRVLIIPWLPRNMQAPPGSDTR